MADDHRSLSAAIQVPPLSRLNERCPIEWMTPVPAPQHLQLHLPQSLTAPLSSPERFVIRDYYIFRQFVRDRPETYDLALRSGKDQRAPQALHPLAILDLPQTRIARGEHHQLRSPQIQSRHLQRGQQAVIISALALIGSRSAKPERSSGSLTRAANLLSRRPENVSMIGCEFADGAGAGFVVTWAIVGAG